MMNKLLMALIFLLSCQTRQSDNKPPMKELLEGDSITQQHQEARVKEEEEAVRQEKYKTFWGYRFHINGDFNGDGKQETLTEKLISTRTGKEIAKFCGFEKDTITDCYWTGRINEFRKPKCLLDCSDPAIGDFSQTVDSTIGTIGMILLQNVGDLNGDRTDEIAFVEDPGGCNSGIREVQLATYKNGKWKVLIKSETRMENDFSWDEKIATPEDLNKPFVKTFEKELMQTPPYFKKEKDKVVYEDYEAATLVTKRRNIDW